MTSPARSFCMVTTFYPPYHFGGDAMYVYRLSNALARRGHRVTVVHSVDAYRLFRRGTVADAYPHEAGVTVRPIKSAVGALTPLVTYLTGRPGLNSAVLDDVFRGESFDVVHFHNISLVGGPGVLSYGAGTKLYTLNEHWLVCPMHVLWKNNREPCVEPACLRCTLTFRRPPQLWRYTSLLDRQLDHVDLFLSPSRFTRDAHRERGFTRPIRVLPYFLPEAEAVAAADEHPLQDPGRPYFLFVGRLERLKGLAGLIERFRRYPHADLLVAGDGGLEQEVRRQAADLANVRFLGRVHPDGLRALYGHALAVIVPSIGYEVFGIVTLEAFAQRTPVIVHDLGALPEPVLESGGGYVYRSDGELLDAMEAMRTDPVLRRELGERGHRTWLELWSEEPHLARYLAAVEDAAGRANG